MGKRQPSDLRTKSIFKAAVYEHPVITPANRTSVVPRAVALTNMMQNLEHYKQQAELAATKGVDILVFPEYGIYGLIMTREAIQSYLEFIPDPVAEEWCPCRDPGRFSDSEVQEYLSCLARNNSLYLVANFGDIQRCSKTDDPNCPPDGHYQFNTDIVYDKNGVLIARYHKETLYGERQFNKPNSVEYIYFDTPFGRFGVFTCFDILFDAPAMKLVLDYNVTNIVFPTAWIDALPFLAAIQFHSAFAAGTGVNLLAANIHYPRSRFHGSGINTPDGSMAYYYNDQSNDGKLLVADLHVLKSNRASRFRQYHSDQAVTKPFQFTYDNKGEFKWSIRYDSYTCKELSEVDGDLTVCQNSLCCHLEYKGKNSTETFAFGVLDNLHRSRGDRNYYLQICALLKCASAVNGTCQYGSKYSYRGKYSSTTFSRIKITGNFSTKYIFPEILLADGESLALAQIGNWSFSNDMLEVGNVKKPLLSASLLGRIYNRDTFNYLPQISSSTSLPVNSVERPMHAFWCLYLYMTVIINIYNCSL